MNKVAQYLNEHIAGEITANKSIRERYSRDGSILSIMPELVMFPRVTNDIRKAARFSWQLAEKGHTMPIIVRGCGSDNTGASIGKGLIVNTTRHLSDIIHIALKDKEHVVHVQPGIKLNDLNNALNWHGLCIPASPYDSAHTTAGGAVANNSRGKYSGKHGTVGDAVVRLEVVLANGDLIETSRLSKKDFSKKKGLQTFEGEIYRKLDGLIEDNQAIIKEKVHDDGLDNAGYARIGQVRHHDGSFDLTPLFIGSQGTLGIISEMVLRSEFINPERQVIVASIESEGAARDAVDALVKLDPASLEGFSGEIFKLANKTGKVYPFQNSTDQPIGSVLYIQFDDLHDRTRSKKMKKAIKILDSFQASYVTSADYSLEELDSVLDVEFAVMLLESDDQSMPPLVDGSHIPAGRYEDFCIALDKLAEKHHVAMPLHRRVLDGIVTTRPILDLSKVADKQKVFKIISEYSELVESFGGTFVADGGEGRLKANAAYRLLDEDVVKLYADVRDIFDPYQTLNPGVKQSNDLKSLVGSLRSSYDISDFTN